MLARSLSLQFLTLCLSIAHAQTCHYGQGEAGLNADLKALHARPTCQQAYELYRKCLWGSSADSARADVVIAKCKAGFQGKLTLPQRGVLQTRLNLCQMEYEGMDGTLWLSEASSCATAVYLDFAIAPAKASQPVPRASFDCKRAQSPQERVVCADTLLGRYDLLMSNAYKSFLQGLKDNDRAALVQNLRAWNASTPGACPLPTAQPTTATLTCLRKRYRERMQNLDQCAAGSDVSCLDSSIAEQ